MDRADDAIKLAVLETKQNAHEKQCDERAERTADDVSAIRATMERESTERKASIARIGERMENVERSSASIQTNVAAMQSTLEALPATLAEQIRAQMQNAKQSSQLWFYGKAAAIGGGLLSVGTLMWEIFGKH